MRALKLGFLAAAAAGMVTLSGCEGLLPMGPSMVEQHMGEAVQANIAAQTENPNASQENTAIPRVDPDTAAVVMDRYFETQSQPAQKQTPSIIQIDAK